MDTKTFDCFPELRLFINGLTDNPNYIYRGYNRDEEIYPSIIHGEDFSMLEGAFLREFERYGLAYFSANNAMEFLSTAQHYGLPTRLLDFTYNPFVAMFFSLYNVKAKTDDPYYKIIYCDIRNCCKFNEISRTADEPCEPDGAPRSFTNELLTRFATLGDANRLCIVDPALNNQRIIMQQGLFLVPTTLDKEKHRVLIEENTSKILIHKSIRHEAMRYLDVLGFNAFRLMPDLASACQAIKNRVIARGVRK